MDYLQPLIVELENHSNHEKAQWMIDYLKGQFDFLGLTSKERGDIQKAFIKEYGYPAYENLFDIVFYLWEQEQREYQYFAIELLQKQTKNFKEDDIQYIERLIKSKSWWDSVDGLAIWICGDYFKKFPEQIIPVTTDWLKSGNMWLQRSVLIFQLKYKSDLNTTLLEAWILELAGHKDFFIRKAIGWILREYSKTNPEWVVEFVSKHELSGLSKREALKVINKLK